MPPLAQFESSTGAADALFFTPRATFIPVSPGGLPLKLRSVPLLGRRLMLAALLTGLLPGGAFAAPPALPAEGLVLPPVGGGGGRSAVAADALVAQLVSGSWTAPRAGDAVKLPNGSDRKWDVLKADHSNATGGRCVHFSVTSGADTVMLLQASGHQMVYVNGEPRAGDPYGHGYVRLPILRRQGSNDLLFQVGRGQLQAKREEPKSAGLLHLADTTAPSLIVAEKPQAWGAVVVINATARPLDGLSLEAQLDDSVPTATG